MSWASREKPVTPVTSSSTPNDGPHGWRSPSVQSHGGIPGSSILLPPMVSHTPVVPSGGAQPQHVLPSGYPIPQVVPSASVQATGVSPSAPPTSVRSGTPGGTQPAEQHFHNCTISMAPPTYAGRRDTKKIPSYDGSAGL